MAKKKKSPPFVMIRYDLLKDKEFRQLSNSAKIVYIYMRAKFNYKTLSEVTLTYSEMNDVMGTQAMSNALKELVNKEWIIKVVAGGLMGGCSTYRFNGRFKDFYRKGHTV